MKRLQFPLTHVAAAVLAAVVGASVLTHAQVTPPTLTASAVGATVNFSWTPVADATEYVLQAGVAPGNYILTVPVGLTTATSAQAPAVGTYYARVGARTPSGDVWSAGIPITVTAMVAPPTAPTALTTYLNGRSALITWTPGVGGGAPSGYILHAGTTPGGTEHGVFPLGATPQLAVPNLGAGDYHLRLFAVNAGGVSPASNDTLLSMPQGGGCSVPPARDFTFFSFGRFAQFTWLPVPGASGYRIDVATSPGGAPAASQTFAANAGNWSITGAPLGTFHAKLTTAVSCGQQATSAEKPIVLDGAPPPGPRAPNPAPGQRLPFPSWGEAVVEQLAAERRDLLFQSCTEHGGNNRFMFELVRRLRQRDNRFGLNWKRGNYGDLSQDIVNYNFGSEPDEGTENVYIVDIIGGHCGSNPSAAWINQTDATRAAGTKGVWTLLPYMNAGFPIVSDQQ
ncbi:MAG: hypothetical protein IT178_09680 [Acidobacteria bacterium]|nr:hypothetical protein [Acidobacteriota bacterium]